MSLLIGGRRGGALIAAAAVASAGTSLLAQVLAERALGVAGFALWTHFNALLLLFAPWACLGSNHLLLSEYAHGRLHRRSEAWRLARFYGLALGVTLPVFVLVCQQLLAPQGGVSPWLAGLLLAVNAAVVLMFPLFQLAGSAAGVALWPLGQVASRAAAAGLALVLAWSAIELLWAWFLAFLGLALVGAVALRPLLRDASDKAPDGASRNAPPPGLLRPALLFGVSDMLDSLDLKLIVPLAAAWFGTASTAAAGIVMVMLSAMVFLPHVLVARVLLPAVHREGPGSVQLRSVVWRTSAIGGLAILPLAMIAAWWGPTLVAAVARGDYAADADAIRLVGLCLLPLALSMLGAAPFMERTHARALLGWRVEGLAVFVLLAFALRGLGLPALLWAMAGGRTWLCARTFLALRRLGAA